jgi:prepilin-type N-terminal cleavage/methylation domain-containing protein
MRRGFTLIELMIVIAIIAIIAAIAIPNLLESRISSQEAASAAALKSGLLPAEVQFQAGGYADRDNNGIGTFCVTGALNVTHCYDTLSGQAAIGSITLNLLPPSFNGDVANVTGYSFKSPITETAPTGTQDFGGERVWGVIAYPIDNSSGRRFFAINQSGNVYASKPSTAASSGSTDVGGLATAANSANLFGASLVSSPVSSYYLPYRK